MLRSPAVHPRRSTVTAVLALHRDLGWLRIVLGHHEYNAYWKGKLLHHRWRGFEVKRGGFAVGPLMVLSTGRDRQLEQRPRLRAIEGGRG